MVAIVADNNHSLHYRREKTEAEMSEIGESAIAETTHPSESRDGTAGAAAELVVKVLDSGAVRDGSARSSSGRYTGASRAGAGGIAASERMIDRVSFRFDMLDR
jgi:hypothetical protein